jgi:hypothetical protein
MPSDPLDEYEATLRAARTEAQRLAEAAGKFHKEQEMVRELMHELAAAVRDSTEREHGR